MHSIGNVYCPSMLLLQDRQSTSLGSAESGDADNRHFMSVPSIIDRLLKFSKASLWQSIGSNHSKYLDRPLGEIGRSSYSYLKYR